MAEWRSQGRRVTAYTTWLEQAPDAEYALNGRVLGNFLNISDVPAWCYRHVSLCHGGRALLRLAFGGSGSVDDGSIEAAVGSMVF